MKVHLNASTARGDSLPPATAERFGPGGAREVARWLQLCPRHSATPLFSLPTLAAQLGIRTLLVKDEANRLGLSSFKALGGAYAVARFVHRHVERVLSRSVPPSELREPSVRAAAATLTVTCATDGNHGRSVAAGASVFGCKAVIYVHEGVSSARVAAIAKFGADVRRVPGNYEDSVQAAAEAARRSGWILLADTTDDPADEGPELVMQGYTVMASECIEASLKNEPTHVFLQAGVGGMAAAVAAHWKLVRGDSAPRFVVVEPEAAACLFATAANGDHAVTLGPTPEPTIMAMLDCQTPSTPAYSILQRLVHAYVTVSDHAAVRAMNLLARPPGNDPCVVSGESGAAGLAALLEVQEQRELAVELQLTSDSVVLVINTEGATDPNLYKSLTDTKISCQE